MNKLCVEEDGWEYNTQVRTPKPFADVNETKKKA